MRVGARLLVEHAAQPRGRGVALLLDKEELALREQAANAIGVLLEDGAEQAPRRSRLVRIAGHQVHEKLGLAQQRPLGRGVDDQRALDRAQRGLEVLRALLELGEHQQRVDAVGLIGDVLLEQLAGPFALALRVVVLRHGQ